MYDDYVTLVRQAQSAATAEKRHAALNPLLAAFRAMAYHYAYALLGDSQLAEDAIQDAFITVDARIGQLREPEAFPMWLRRIVHSHCTRLTRGKHIPLVPIDASADLHADTPLPEQALAQQELIAIVQNAVRALPDHERDVTEGFYFMGESQQEIAERLHIPVTTVKKRLQYARKRLRVLIAEFNEALDAVFQPSAKPQQQWQPVPIRSEKPIYRNNEEEWRGL